MDRAGFRTRRDRQASLRRNQSALSVITGAWARRLPLPLWRRRGGRSHHLLRPAVPRGFQLLRAALSSDSRPGHAIETGRRHGRTQAGGGGMKREPKPTLKAAAVNTSVAVMVFRMRPLPRRHRIAHLRALIGQTPLGSIRRVQLVALLRDEMILPCSNERCAG